MPQYKDAEGNFIDIPATPIDNHAKKSSSLQPEYRATANATLSGTPINAVNVISNGQYLAVISNPA